MFRCALPALRPAAAMRPPVEGYDVTENLDVTDNATERDLGPIDYVVVEWT